MGKKKQRWGVGDVFEVPTADGGRVIGQIVGQEPSVLNSASVAFFEGALEATADVTTLAGIVQTSRAFSVMFVTRDRLDQGDWRVLGTLPVSLPRSMLPFETLRGSQFVGARIIGSGIVEQFLNAYRGIGPWDAMKDPEYFDKLLVDAGGKPKNLVFKKS